MDATSTQAHYDYFRGDMVFAAVDLFNEEVDENGESMMPEAAPGALLAAAGTRGMIVNVGHPESAPEQVIYLVSFETGPLNGSIRELGLPFGCFSEELTQTETVG